MSSSTTVEITGVEDCSAILLLQSNSNEILKNQQPKTVLSVKDQPRITKFENGSYDAVIAFTNQPFAPAINNHILRVLKPGGLFVVQGSKQADFKRSLLYSGFANVSNTSTNDVTSQWRCSKADTEMKAAPLKLNFKKKIETNDNTLNSNNNDNNITNTKNVTDEKTDTQASAWTIASNDMLEDDIGQENELEDENLLLENETEKVLIENTKAFDDCGVGGIGSTRKPCKNCTCGRAEQMNSNENDKSNEKGNDSNVKIAEFKSSCGNCHLGDAFRCSGCPYLGMPAFDPNQTDKVKLLITDDTV